MLTEFSCILILSKPKSNTTHLSAMREGCLDGNLKQHTGRCQSLFTNTYAITRSNKQKRVIFYKDAAKTYLIDC